MHQSFWSTCPVYPFLAAILCHTPQAQERSEQQSRATTRVWALVCARRAEQCKAVHVLSIMRIKPLHARCSPFPPDPVL
eukprot:1300914-Rhodomonas_salina.3